MNTNEMALRSLGVKRPEMLAAGSLFMIVGSLLAGVFLSWELGLGIFIGCFISLSSFIASLVKANPKSILSTPVKAVG